MLDLSLLGELALAVPAMVMELNDFDVATSVATVARLPVMWMNPRVFPTFRAIYLGECLYATRRVLLRLFDYRCNQNG